MCFSSRIARQLVVGLGQIRPGDQRRYSWRVESSIVLVLLASIVALWLPRLAGPLDLRWDGAVYYVLGTALAEHKGYRLLNEPGEIEAVTYPPLLPAIIAAHQRLLGTSDPLIVGSWLRISFFLMFSAYMLAGYALFRRFLPLAYALAATAICLLNYSTTFLSNVCFAEIPFALVTILFVLVQSREQTGFRTILGALLATAAYLLRTVGIALFLAWVGESLLQRRFKLAAVRFAVSLLPILAWHSYIAHVEGGSSYNNPQYKYQRADYLFYNVTYARNLLLREPFTPQLGKATPRDLVSRVARNMTHIPFGLSEGVIAKADYWHAAIGWVLHSLKDMRGIWRLDSESVTFMVLTLAGTFILAGVVALFLQKRQLIALYIVSYIAIVCLTPLPEQWWRYFAALAPFLTLALFQMVLAIQAAGRRYVPAPLLHTGAVTRGLLLCLLLTFQILVLVDLYLFHHEPVQYRNGKGMFLTYPLFYYDSAYQALDMGLEWLKQHAGRDEIIAVSMPQWAYVRTGLKAVMPPFEPDLDKAQDLLDSVPVRYVILDSSIVNLTQSYTLPLLQRHPEFWTRVYSIEDGNLEIYQRTKR